MPPLQDYFSSYSNISTNCLKSFLSALLKLSLTFLGYAVSRYSFPQVSKSTYITRILPLFPRFSKAKRIFRMPPVPCITLPAFGFANRSSCNLRRSRSVNPSSFQTVRKVGSASNFPVVRPCERLCGRFGGWVGQLPQQGFSRRIGNGGGQVTWLALPAAVRKKAEKICIMLCLSRYGTSRWTVDPPTLAFQSTDGRKSP